MLCPIKKKVTNNNVIMYKYVFMKNDSPKKNATSKNNFG